MQISLSNDVIRSRICDISDHFLCETVSEIKASQTKISIQLDETTDVSNCSQLLVFARYVYQKEVKEKFLFCQPLELTTKAVDILKAVKDFFSSHDINLGVVGSICTDGCPAMLGHCSGFATLIQAEVPGIKVTHCDLHRYALAAKTLPPGLKEVMGKCVKVVNVIRITTIEFSKPSAKVWGKSTRCCFITQKFAGSRGEKY